MAQVQEKGQSERLASVREAQASEPFSWERQPGESIQAFTRFMTYRDLDPSERSQVKVADICGISAQLVARWGKRWSWLKRSLAYDMWMLELSDKLGKRAVLGHRHRLVSFGSASLAKASGALAKLDETKLSADEAIALAVNGAKLERQGLGLVEGPTVADRAPSASVSVSLGLGQLGWAQPRQIEGTNTNQTKQNEVVVLAGEQVIAETPAGSPRARLAERIVNCPPAKGRVRASE